MGVLSHGICYGNDIAVTVRSLDRIRSLDLSFDTDESGNYKPKCVSPIVKASSPPLKLSIFPNVYVDNRSSTRRGQQITPMNARVLNIVPPERSNPRIRICEISRRDSQSKLGTDS